ncbi:hypothetical protein BH09BAC5_BH09BAC5_17560 [soil metagenome]
MGNKIPFRMSARLYTTVPHAFSNKAFRHSFTGIYDIVANCNFQVFHGFQIGIGYHHNLWKTPDNKIPGLNTYAQSHLGGIRIGYDFVRSETSTAYVAVSGEKGIVHFTGLSYSGVPANEQPKKIYDVSDLQVETGIFFYTEGNFAIGMNVSATFTEYQFNPFTIYLNQHNPRPYLPEEYSSNWGYFNFGFNVVYSFWKTNGAAAN